jgi:sensitive to high expression protein 9
MSLIRSEHLNDKAVREAKEALADAETALEESRSHLEKRERAQYHEEQIWSDTIRRNSTWVTFGLMGVNIFLLLLSLLILEPWRRRRMVREIKNALEAQKVAMEVSPVPATAATPASLPAEATASASAMVAPAAVAAPAVPAKDLATIEAEIDKVVEPATEPIIPPPTSSTSASMEESPTAGTEELQTAVDPSIPSSDSMSASVSDLAGDPTTVPQILTNADADINASAQESIATVEEPEITADVPPNDKMRSRLEIWQWKATTIAQDIVSERSISMRRVDYTTAMLQAAAAGAVIAAAIIAMMRPY